MAENPQGRPTKYKSEYCDMLVAHMAQGLSFESFAAVVGVCRDTLYEWASAHEDFSYNKKRAFDACLYWWEKEGIQSLDKRFYQPAIWVMNMKARFGWSDKVEVSNQDQKPFVLNYKIDG